MKASRLENLLPCALIAIASVALFHSALVNDYGYMDDYWQLFHVNRRDDELWKVLVGAGRPLNWILLESVYRLFSTPEDFKLIRILNVLSVAALACFVYAVARQHFGRLYACAVAIALLALPSTQMMVFWTQHWTMPIGGMLVLVGTLTALIAADASRDTFRRAIAGMASFLCLVAAGHINQSLLGLYWAFFFLLGVMAKDGRTSLRTVVTAVALFAAATCFVVLSVRLLPPDLITNRAALLKSHYIEKLLWYAEEPLINALQIFALRSHVEPLWQSQSIYIALINGVVVATWFSLLERRVGWRRATWAILLFVGCLFGAGLHMLAIREDWASYRAIWGLALLVLFPWLHCVIALSRVAIQKLGKPEAVLALRVGIVLAGAAWLLTAQARFADVMVEPQVREYQYTRKAIAAAAAELHKGHYQAIYFKSPIYTHNVDKPAMTDARRRPATAYDEIRPSSWARWVPVPLFHLIAEQLPEHDREVLLRARFKFHYGWKGYEPGDLVIDMQPTAQWGLCAPDCAWRTDGKPPVSVEQLTIIPPLARNP